MKVVASLSSPPAQQDPASFTEIHSVAAEEAIVETLPRPKRSDPGQWQIRTQIRRETPPLSRWTAPAGARGPPLQIARSSFRASLHPRSYPINLVDPSGLMEVEQLERALVIAPARQAPLLLRAAGAGLVRGRVAIPLLAGGVVLIGAAHYYVNHQEISIWDIDGRVRGEAIENHLAATDYSGWTPIGRADRGYFPLIDFQKGSEVISLKTAGSYYKQNVRDLQGHMIDLAQSVEVNDAATKKTLDLRVPDEDTARLYRKSLSSMARRTGVNLNISVFQGTVETSR